MPLSSILIIDTFPDLLPDEMRLVLALKKHNIK